MKKIILLILLIIFTALLKAQDQLYNLINNYSFEDSIKCPYAQGQVEFAKHWIAPVTISSPAEYYNGNCSGGLGGAFSTPNAICGYQIPKTGKAYIGFHGVAHAKSKTNIDKDAREYIETQFIDLLKINNNYYINFYISLADKSGYAISSMGAHISDTLIHKNSDYKYFPLPTQIQNIKGKIIADTINWTKISGIYKAQGGEQYITIGNFNTDSLSDTLCINPSAWLFESAYYYLDDVSVYDITAEAGRDTAVCGMLKDSVQLGSHGLSFCKYQWSPIVGLGNPNIATPKAMPSVNTTYTLTVSFADTVFTGAAIDTIYTSVTTDTVVIKVDSWQLAVSSSKNNICTGESVVLTASGGVLYTWNGGQSAENITVSPTANTTYTVTGTNTDGCSNTTEVVINVNQPPNINGNGNLSICKGQSTALSADGCNSYIWSNGINNSSIIVTPTNSTTYFVTGSDNNGCTAMDSVIVNVINLQSPVINLGKDTAICIGDEVTIQLPINDYTYIWQDSSKLNYYTVRDTGLYIVRATNICGSFTDSIHFREDNCYCNVDVPSAFSPNGDRENDILYLRGKCVENINFYVYNRWGQKVFESHDLSQGWDGTFNGKKMDMAVFVYYLSAETSSGEKRIIKKQGTISLIR
ncbi:MAG: gliding motility-associated C-terminal domain-containing protein [Bacteroidales bacterium]|jgi:gliding motility-associated-like protein